MAVGLWPTHKALLDKLDEQGFLWAKDGKQRQVKVRRSTSKDRVYCIALEEPVS